MDKAQSVKETREVRPSPYGPVEFPSLPQHPHPATFRRQPQRPSSPNGVFCSYSNHVLFLSFPPCVPGIALVSQGSDQISPPPWCPVLPTWPLGSLHAPFLKAQSHPNNLFTNPFSPAVGKGGLFPKYSTAGKHPSPKYYFISSEEKLKAEE